MQLRTDALPAIVIQDTKLYQNPGILQSGMIASNLFGNLVMPPLSVFGLRAESNTHRLITIKGQQAMKMWITGVFSDKLYTACKVEILKNRLVDPDGIQKSFGVLVEVYDLNHAQTLSSSPSTESL